MSNPAVMVAVRAHMAAITGLPSIVWPNEEIRVQPPFLIWDDGPTVGRPITIDGEERFEFRPQVSLMVQPGSFTATGDAILRDIAQAFKWNTKITSGGAFVAYCLQTPTADNGRPDGGYFRRDMTLRIASDQQI
ncbi:DUF4128 domain-containing protein [Oceaniglobus trochenteri]|uniref:DUF4128 domain-containing protein n=1 Tax=Oceaniglobus trochenteri TaxID=2763260 RepID=UPI001CFFFD62|nr:DUF4128 domain-containing protein [Oceaniglobus trochenteri]